MLLVVPVAMIASVAPAQGLAASGYGSPVEWSTGPFLGNKAILAADVDHDDDADLIGLNSDTAGVQVMQSNRAAFLAPNRWLSPAFWGKGNLTGYFDGDPNADLLVLTDSAVWVSRSAASVPDSRGFFTLPQRWYLRPFYGNVANLAGDVDADGDTDLINVQTSTTIVARSTGVTFATPSIWNIEPTVGGVATLTGDADGDRDSDIIAVDSVGVRVMAASRTWFMPAAQWSTEPFHGTRKTLAADPNGDGRTDLIAIDDAGIRVLPSNGSAFSAPEQWSTTPFFGTRETLAADVDADGDDDLIAVNDTDTWVLLAQ
jgi:hypothetical protein